MRAFAKAKPEIIKSDQGCQFTSNKYIDLLKSNGVNCERPHQALGYKHPADVYINTNVNVK